MRKTKINNIMVLLIIITFFTILAVSISLPYLSLLAREEISATLAEVGLIAAARSMSAAALAIPFGLASAFIGRAKLLALGVLIIMVGLVAITFATDITFLLLTSVLFSLGLVLFEISTAAIIGDISNPAELAKSFGYYTASMSSAVSIGPIIGGATIGVIGFKTTFLLSGAIASVVAILAIIFVLRRRRFDFPKPIAKSHAWGEVRGNKTMWSGVLLFAVGSFLEGGFGPFIPIYGRFLMMSTLSIGILFGLSFAASTLTRIIVGSRLDRTGASSTIVVTGLVLVAISISVLAIIPDVYYLAFSTIIFGIGFGIIRIISVLIVSKSMKSEVRGFSMGIFGTMKSLTHSLGAITVATIITIIGETQLGYQTSFALLAVPAYIAIFYVYVIKYKFKF